MRSSLSIIAVLAFLCVFAPEHSAQEKNLTGDRTPITLGETVHIKSQRLGEDREILVYLPASYKNSNQRYPVIYALDGESTAAATASAVVFMTSYSELPQMPEAIVVGITNKDRPRDMPVPQEYGIGRGEENFLAFIGDELVPMIEKSYRTQPLRILVGHSQGGLFAYYAMTARPSLFQWYLPIDAPMSGFPRVRPIMDKARVLVHNPANYYARLVAIENVYGWINEWPSFADGASKNVYITRFVIKDESHESMFFKAVYEGLKRLFYDYSPETKDAKLPELEAKYKALSNAYGYQVPIPQQVLLRSVDRNLLNGVEAMKLIQRAVSLYGESPATTRLRAAADEAIKKGGPDPRLEEWAKLPPPAVETMGPFLGKWDRVTDDGASWDLTFEVNDRVVHTRYSVVPPNARPFELVLAFVRVIDGQTVQWGEHNGNGPGVMVYTAKLLDEGKTLKGETEKVGFLEPPNAPQPPKDFIFKRRPVNK